MTVVTVYNPDGSERFSVEFPSHDLATAYAADYQRRYGFGNVAVV